MSSVRHGSEGSSILVTTRSEKVAIIMGTISPYHLEGLSDGNCFSNKRLEMENQRRLRIWQQLEKKLQGSERVCLWQQRLCEAH